MTMFKKPEQYRRIALLGAACMLGLAGCAESYVVLLPDDNGVVGQVQVTTAQGQTVLSNAREAAHFASAGQTYVASEAQIQNDFSGALDASPQKPKSFLLYFDGGTVELNEESKNRIADIIGEIKQRPAVDISVIGHTDTVGDEDANARLSLKRAQEVAKLFTESIPDAQRMFIESHGEKNLLIATPDDVDEPRNRRVEVIVR